MTPARLLRTEQNTKGLLYQVSLQISNVSCKELIQKHETIILPMHSVELVDDPGNQHTTVGTFPLGTFITGELRTLHVQKTLESIS